MRAPCAMMRFFRSTQCVLYRVMRHAVLFMMTFCSACTILSLAMHLFSVPQPPLFLGGLPDEGCGGVTKGGGVAQRRHYLRWLLFASVRQVECDLPL